jgi:hypothetical protein
MRKILLVCMAVFIVAISGCENASSFSESNKRRPNYNIEYYLDTIYGNVLISTICHNNSDLSISTTLVGKVDTGSERENNSENTASNYTNSNYDINYYLDTICGNVIITTVCDNKSDLSVSSLLIGKVDYN